MENPPKTAPIVIPTLHRFEHLRKCISSLANCALAEATDIFISIDCPPSEKYEEGHRRILAYLKDGIDGFRSVTVFHHEKNLGAVANCAFLKEQAFAISDKLIFTEDDNYFSPNFLVFMNQALDLFQNDDKVSSVSGYSSEEFIALKLQANTIKSYNSSSWGIGLWRDKERQFEAVGRDYYEHILLNWPRSMKVFRHFPIALDNLINMFYAGADYGDTRRSCRNIIEDTFQICPKLSLVKNLGHDGSGIHGGTIFDDPFAKQTIDEASTFEFIGPPVCCAGTKRVVFNLGLSDKKLLKLARILFSLERFRLTHNNPKKGSSEKRV